MEKFKVLLFFYFIFYVLLISFFVSHLNGSYINWIKPDLEELNGYSQKISSGLIPIKNFTIEYPVGLISIIAILSPVSSNFSLYSFIFGFIQLSFTFGILLLLYKILEIKKGDKKRILFFAFSPTLLLYNWARFESTIMFFFILGLYYYFKKNFRDSGILVGIASSFKWFPFAFSLATFLNKKRKILWFSFLVFLILNIPLNILNLENATHTYSFQLNRAPNPDSFYGLLQHYKVSNDSILLISIITFLSLFFFTKWHSDVTKTTISIISIFLLSSRVFSPQFVLWLLPLLIIEKIDLPFILLLDVVNVFVFPFFYGQNYLFDVMIVMRQLTILFILFKMNMFSLHVKSNLSPIKDSLIDFLKYLKRK